MAFLKLSLRWWIPGLLCLACGAATKIVLGYVGWTSKLDLAREMVFQLFWFSLGLIFLRVDMHRRWEELHDKDSYGLYHMLWWVALVASIVAVWSTCAVDV